jgi:DNA-binding transcriptional LysR family regulator
MELRHLRYFVAVAEERHVTRAARRLGIQQPPLSLQIRALESELGVTLFTRGARGVELTVAGRVLLEEAYDILASVDRATTRTRQAARGEVGRLSVGFTTSAVLHPLVPAIIHAYRGECPHVELDLREDPAADLIEGLVRRDIRVALMRVPVARPPELAFIELLEEELLLVLPAGHRLLRRPGGDGAVALRELEEERFILVRRPGAPGIYQNLILACRAAGFEPLIAAEVPHMLTNINLVAAGAGISVVPASMHEVNLRQVGYCRLINTPQLTAPLTLSYLADDPDPIVHNFIAVTRGLITQATSG